MTQALHQAFTAIARLPHVFHGNRADLAIEGDADRPHVLEAPVDVIFSNAVFHWIDKRLQPRMLGCVFDALKNVGQFVFEMGGKGNNAMMEITIKIDRYSKATSIGDPMTPTTL